MRFLLVLWSVLLFFSSVFGHDFDGEALEYILSQEWSSATWSVFEEEMKELDPTFEFSIPDTNAKLGVALSLPHNEYIWAYVTENPDFSFEEFTNLVGDDPMIGELWNDNAYAFIKEALARNGYLVDETVVSAAQAEAILWGQASGSFWEYVRLGWEHIIWWYDHLLFVLALVIALPWIRYILSIITTFTVAHSLTILLGSLWIIALPSVFVESVIVISIVVAAILSRNKKVGELWSTPLWKEVSLVFALGLIHWLWFSSFFIDVSGSASEVVLPILGFNLWVEVGQLVVLTWFVLVLTLLYRLLGTKKDLAKKVIIVLLCLIATYWTVQMWV